MCKCLRGLSSDFPSSNFLALFTWMVGTEATYHLSQKQKDCLNKRIKKKTCINTFSLCPPVFHACLHTVNFCNACNFKARNMYLPNSSG